MLDHSGPVCSFGQILQLLAYELLLDPSIEERLYPAQHGEAHAGVHTGCGWARRQSRQAIGRARHDVHERDRGGGQRPLLSGWV